MPKAEINVTHTISKYEWYESLIQAMYGMSMDELAQELKENKDGKYDRFYKKE